MEENNPIVTGLFTIKVKRGAIEIEVSAPDRDFVLEESGRLIEELNLTSIPLPIVEVDYPASSNGEISASASNSNAKGAKQQTFTEFWKQFSHVQTHGDKMLVIGYWCEIKLEQPHFTVEDIQTKYKELRETLPTQIKRDLGTLRSRGFLMPPEKSDEGETYTLTKTGIKEVESKMTQA